MDRISALQELGQSIWLDNINRRMILNGELKQMIDRGEIRGVTSNPTIFNNAISKSTDYNSAIQSMAWAGWENERIFWQLAFEDILNATNLFASLYQKTGGADGFVSLEVDPRIAYDAEKMFKQTESLWKTVNRPNLMIKIPGTKAGLKAIRKALAKGININITLIFSIERYKEVIEAYFSALEERVKAGLPIRDISSVASFFVSRVDTKVDPLLDILIQGKGKNALLAEKLLGKAAIANSKMAYQIFQEAFQSERFRKLHAKGARLQRPLWASTSTKNPAYCDTLYVDDLVAKNSVNTIPVQTLEAIKDHAQTRISITDDLQKAQESIVQLERFGISMKQVTDELEEEGIRSFSESYDVVSKTIDTRRKEFIRQLGSLKKTIPERVDALAKAKVVENLFDAKPNLWTKNKKGQQEFKIRLGWLNSPAETEAEIKKIQQLAEACVNDGLTHALLLGMGGSSLAPEVFRNTFGVGMIEGKPALDLAILDSTDPEQVLAAKNRSAVDKTLYIVSSKSGTTAEVNAFLSYFWDIASKQLGKKASAHFIAITDPGTPLEKTAEEKGFRAIFNGDPDVGGRYSALTAFGLVPAGLMGIDLEKLIGSAKRMQSFSTMSVPAGRNPGLVLGAILGEAAELGRDKLTFIADPEIESMGSWLEQLVAESSGKEGKGIVPIDLEPLVDVSNYGIDRLFVYFRKSGVKDKFVENLRNHNIPALSFQDEDLYDVGGEFYRWEIAVAVACAVFKVNPFDQPDVQLAKTITYKKLDEFKKKGIFEEKGLLWEGKEGKVFGKGLTIPRTIKELSNVTELFLKKVKKGDFVAVNAFVPRNPETLKELQKLRKEILLQTKKATTLGFGPRYLHSTGQMHKGGANNGVFIEITHDSKEDVDIPDLGLPFSILEKGQALGELETLQTLDRPVIRVHTNRKLGGLLKKRK